ncbi:flagellar basal-body MS-ring/collar protein FliF [Aeromonas hydrophila]|uniref:flagellar basal-body MS-ring/collar protein FliF n=1 Tax=Aeromonas hydrophila TaxID=644 RepID=UPI0005D91543|nr:flagellar basal-body MS-ring/collar protein FliF [Aeromonas hydrophila]AKA18230.1 flagellar M-ring protein FliF [Aeromonas hydrophila]HAT2246426.1 flagellar basal body M-ring protein FliF [Aeromonas hydrophila]HAT2381846.1 flagellar basal body M-ring protein FliF [Aeromonas hydrophila]HAT2414833.1 flagellar basal body M-ring protein FliF [Aeromonas hydrophila]HAT2525314.1 flagellar basal body M-ring protein FliF [Aeromonas hydrophila]
MANDQNGELLMNDEGSAALDENEQKSSALGFLSNTDVLRQITLILGLAICLAIAVFILLWGKEPDMRPLGTYTTQELVKTLDYLDQQKILYQVDGKSVLVSAENYSSIRLALTRAGLANATDTTSDGEDILLKDSSFGVSQRMESERLKLSRERQLASAIEQFQNVAKAQVLLAIPKDNVFARNERKPSATVVLSLKGNALGQGEVDSIVDMVASAVHGLEPTRVTVTDQNGRLLNSGSQDPVSAQTRKEFAMQQKQELEYKQKIDAILIPVLGADNYTAEVDLSLDFSQQEQTRKTYNPDLPAVRSEMTMEENSANGSNGGVPGALSNQPPAASNIPQQATGPNAETTASSSGRSRKEATRNFELDTTVSHIRRQMGGIRRMTVSVAVDYKASTAADGKVTREPRTQPELDTLRRLLSGGLGFDVTRGDTLEVVAIPFNRPELESVAEAPLYEQPWFWRAVRIAASVLVIIVLIVTVVRPMLKRLLYPDAKPEGELDFDNHTVLGGDDELSLLAAQAESEPVFGVRDGHLKLPDLHRDEDLLKAVRALVANEPDLAAQVIKEWVANKDG